MSYDKLHVSPVSTSTTRSSSPIFLDYLDKEVSQILRDDLVFEYIGGSGSCECSDEETLPSIIYSGTYCRNNDSNSQGNGNLICIDEIPSQDGFYATGLKLPIK